MKATGVLLAVSLAANVAAAAYFLGRGGGAPEPGPGETSDPAAVAQALPSAPSPPPATAPLREPAGTVLDAGTPPPTEIPATPAGIAQALRAALGREPTAEEVAGVGAFRDERARTTGAAYVEAVLERQAAEQARELANLEQIRRSKEAEEDAKRGGPIQFLKERKEKRSGPVFDFVAGAEFESWFDRKARGSVLSLAPDGPAPATIDDGDVLRFAPGAHKFSVRRWQNVPFPKDLTLEGYGVDKTIVTFDEFGDARGAILNLTFRDMTVDAGNQYLFDLRGDDPAIVRFENCRIVRFDMGAGGSLAFGVRTLAVWMTDTSIESGFGRSPTHANLFRVDTLLARLDRCRIHEVHLGTADPGSTLLLSHCRVEDPAGAEPRQDWVRPDDTVFVPPSADPATATKRQATRPLTDINPAWKGLR